MKKKKLKIIENIVRIAKEAINSMLNLTPQSYKAHQLKADLEDNLKDLSNLKKSSKKNKKSEESLWYEETMNDTIRLTTAREKIVEGLLDIIDKHFGIYIFYCNPSTGTSATAMLPESVMDRFDELLHVLNPEHGEKLVDEYLGYMELSKLLLMEPFSLKGMKHAEAEMLLISRFEDFQEKFEEEFDQSIKTTLKGLIARIGDPDARVGDTESLAGLIALIDLTGR